MLVAQHSTEHAQNRTSTKWFVQTLGFLPRPLDHLRAFVAQFYLRFAACLSFGMALRISTRTLAIPGSPPFNNLYTCQHSWDSPQPYVKIVPPILLTFFAERIQLV